jgi:hypothetical protein
MTDWAFSSVADRGNRILHGGPRGACGQCSGGSRPSTGLIAKVARRRGWWEFARDGDRGDAGARPEMRPAATVPASWQTLARHGVGHRSPRDCPAHRTQQFQIGSVDDAVRVPRLRDRAVWGARVTRCQGGLSSAEAMGPEQMRPVLEDPTGGDRPQVLEPAACGAAGGNRLPPARRCRPRSGPAASIVRRNKWPNAAGEAPSSTSRMSLSEGISAMPNGVWQCDRPWPRSSRR